MNVLNEIFAAMPHDPGIQITWGQVVSLAPTRVRFAGDSGDVEVSLRLDDYTPDETHKVLLVKVGRQWVIVGRLTSDA